MRVGFALSASRHCSAACARLQPAFAGAQKSLGKGSLFAVPRGKLPESLKNGPF
ncbi:hypothetical protein PLANPX_2038 [Lacipirellula parvula]|uniref:Uncharacterized protein n=1 Tax=Lacipirellula parvula TaxID=2650471 RepID=A0A5K7XDE5_9BACT|nr:hypothetical protein PLANPX_2038 [Lacipirellula parvula]